MKKFKFEIKEWLEDGTFTGIASMYGNVDYGGDVVEKGAFTKTMTEKQTVPILWQHKTDMPIGIGELEDSGNGLIIKGKLNLDVEKGREAYSLIKQGAVKGLSIGYDVIKDKWEKGIRYLKELRLWEVSVVTFPMNPQATILGVKSVVPYQNLPLADINLQWDGTQAEKNVREWATDSNGSIDWNKYRKAFLWCDKENPEALESYKLNIADVIDGELVAIPKGIMTVSSNIQGSKSKSDIEEEDMRVIKNNLDKYYEKLDREAPWNKSDEEAIEETKRKPCRVNKSKVEMLATLLQEMLSELQSEEDEEDETVNDIPTDSDKKEAVVSDTNKNIDELTQIKSVFDEMRLFLVKNKEEN